MIPSESGIASSVCSMSPSIQGAARLSGSYMQAAQTSQKPDSATLKTLPFARAAAT
jgi:hypothetical protein